MTEKDFSLKDIICFQEHNIKCWFKVEKLSTFMKDSDRWIEIIIVIKSDHSFISDATTISVLQPCSIFYRFLLYYDS